MGPWYPDSYPLANFPLGTCAWTCNASHLILLIVPLTHIHIVPILQVRPWETRNLSHLSNIPQLQAQVWVTPVPAFLCSAIFYLLPTFGRTIWEIGWTHTAPGAHTQEMERWRTIRGRKVRSGKEKSMGCCCIISVEGTRKQKMVCISFHWEQKNRLNYSLFPTFYIPQNLCVKWTRSSCFMFITQEAEMVGGRPRELKKIKSQVISHLSDSTLCMYF